MISLERVLELLIFDEANGEFTRRIQNGAARAGAEAGYISERGYRIISLDGTEYFGHNLAWLITKGEWPPEGFEVDHRNRVRHDNRPSNHRLATRSQNNANMKLRSDNSTGVRGVYLDQRRKKFCVQVTAFGKTRSLGRYDTLEEAAQIARQERKKIWGEFCHEPSQEKAA